MRSFFLLAFPVLVAACSTAADDAPVNDSAASDSAMNVVSVYSEWHTLTESWSESLNLKSASIMKSFYADSVLYYGDPISADDVVKRQTEYFSANSDYKMKISEYIGEEQQPDGSWRVRIIKQVRAGGKTGNYPASLVFAKQNGIWKIIVESDDITDLNKARSNQVSYSPAEVILEGLLEETSGFIISKEGDPKSDGRKKYFILWPSSPLELTASGNMPAEHNVDRLQVEGDSKIITPLLNKKVKITGTLIHQNSPQHFTAVVLNARSVEANP